MRWTAAIAAFAALCLAGCSGSSDGNHSSPPPSTGAPITTAPLPSSSAPPSTPATPTVPADVPTTGPNLRSPGERPPVEPVLATQHSAAGAKAFAEFFIQTIDWGYATTSSAYMRHYYEPSCEQCEVVARLLDNAKRIDGYYVGGRVTIKSGSLISYASRPTVDLRVLVTAVEEFDSKGKPTNADAAYPDLRERIELNWSSGAWVITNMSGKS